MTKPTLCIDFDGVLHSYASGWVEADFIPDPPVEGAFEFLAEAIKKFNVVIYSGRSHRQGGIRAMKTWVEYWARRKLTNEDPTWTANAVINAICYNEHAWPVAKPSAFLTLDDRALTFTGDWPNLDELLTFKPWNKK